MRSTALMAILSLIILFSCSSKNDRTIVQKQREFFVALEKSITQANGQEYDHPYQIKTGEIKEILQNIRYSKKEGIFNLKSGGAVFQTPEIARLAEPLAKALGMAQKNQHVRFISMNRKKTMVFTTLQKTEGIVFVDAQKKVNIAFVYINSKIESDALAYSPLEFSGKDPLQVQRSETQLTPVSGVSELCELEKGMSAPMWLCVHPDGGMKEAVVHEKAAAAQEFSNMKNGETKPAAGPGVSLRQEIKDKLIYLKELLEEGLISKEDYDHRKNGLLDKMN